MSDDKQEKQESDQDSEQEGLDKRAQQTVEEARMVLPGIQALFGFQLVAIFNQRFPQMPAEQQLLHYSALLLIGVAMGLIMAPAAYHRIAEQQGVSRFFVTYGSIMIAISMLPLLTAISFDIYILGRLVIGDQQTSLWIAIAMAALLAILWYAIPFTARAVRRRSE